MEDLTRRGFLKFFGLAVAGIALEEAIPLGRVWSFPSEIVVAKNLEGALNVSTRNFRIPLMYSYSIEYSKLIEVYPREIPLTFSGVRQCQT